MIASAACFAPSRTSIQWRRTVPVHHARIVPPAPMPGLSHRVRWALRPSEQSAHRTSCRREERGTAEESNRLIADHLNRRTRPDGAFRPQRIALPSQGVSCWHPAPHAGRPAPRRTRFRAWVTALLASRRQCRSGYSQPCSEWSACMPHLNRLDRKATARLAPPVGIEPTT